MRTNIFNFLLFFFAITVIPVFSQPVLTQNGILSQPGDSINFKRGSDAPPITDIQGPDVTWNFTYDTAVLTSRYIVTKDPVQTPFFSSFPLAGRCELTKPTSSVKWYSYQTVNAGLLEEIGHVSELLSSSNTYFNYYQDNETLLQFPVYYSDSLMDYFSGYRINGSNDANLQHGKRYYKADSYGTLIYSTGDTFTDVMRVFSVEHRIDSMLLSYDSTTIYETKWYKEGIRTPLITRRGNILWKYTYATQNVFSMSGQYYFCLDPAYINGLITGEEETGLALSEDIRVYPNPCNDRFQISGIDRGKNTISIHSLTGKCVYRAALNIPQSEINVSQLPAGIYFYRVYSDTKMLKSGKLVKN